MKHAFFSSAVASVVCVAAALPMASASAASLVGLTSSNEIARIDTSNIAAATRTAITGLGAGDRFVGIDTRPGDGLIYGVTLSNQIYTVNALTGAATFVAALSAPIVSSTVGYGIDFNPVADYTGAASLRLISSAGSNFAINASTGAVTVASNIGTGYSAIGYSNSALFPTAAPASTSLYYLDARNDVLAVATSNFNSPTLSVVGSLGVDFLNANGFEVLGDGTAFAALNVDNGTSLASSIYSINLATGAATSLGSFNGTLSGLTVSAVPEPGSYLLMLLGLASAGLVATRRSAAEAASKSAGLLGWTSPPSKWLSSPIAAIG